VFPAIAVIHRGSLGPHGDWRESVLLCGWPRRFSPRPNFTTNSPVPPFRKDSTHTCFLDDLSRSRHSRHLHWGCRTNLKDDLTALADRDILLAPVRVVARLHVTTLSGPQTIGGVSLVAGDRVQITAQTTASQNGPWVVQSSAWTRPDDTPAGTGLAGALVFSQSGVSGHYAANSAWLCTNTPGSDIADRACIGIGPTRAPLPRQRASPSDRGARQRGR
jgi:hypothetical protein